MDKSGDRPRLDALTGLRFFAALAVVLYHCAVYFPLPSLVDATFAFGYTGVGFFFVLSGFVLTWSRRTGDSRRRFYWRRFARVWPAHAVMVAASVPVLYLEGHSPTWGAMVPTLLLVQAWIPPGSWHYAFNGQSWSLSCEAFFYAAFPFVIAWASVREWRELRRWLAGGASAMVLAAVVVLLVAPGRTWGFLLYVNPAFRVGEFLLGVGLAVAVERGRRMVRTGSAVAAAAGLYLALVLYQGAVGHVPYGVADLVMLPAWLLLIGAVAEADRFGAPLLALRARTMLKLGEWSFALYLVHQVIVRVAWVHLDGVRLGGWGWLVVTAVVAAAAVGAAWLLYVLVERPAERHIRTRLGAPKRAETSAAAA